MVLRKITLDNAVRYNPKYEQPKETKQNPTKNKNQSEKIQPVSGGGKHEKTKQKLFKKNKKFVKDFTAGGFGVLE